MPAVEFPFPLKGKDENWRVSSQPPLTTGVLLNMRPYDAIGNRSRGGQRPGLAKAYSERIGGNPNYPVVVLIAVATVVS